MHEPAILAAVAGAQTITLGIAGELHIEMDPILKRVVYRGTRDALSAEGLVSDGRDWACMLGQSQTWCDERFRFNLVRERPPGAKGPRRAFQDVDWWRLSVWRRDQRVDHASVAIARKRAELEALAFWQTGEGAELLGRFCAARRDRAYQDFRARIPALRALARRPSSRRGAERAPGAG